MSPVLAMQEKIDPGLKIPLVGWLMASGGIIGRSGWYRHRVGQGDFFGDDDFLFAGSGQAKVLAGG